MHSFLYVLLYLIICIKHDNTYLLLLFTDCSAINVDCKINFHFHFHLILSNTIFLNYILNVYTLILSLTYLLYRYTDFYLYQKQEIYHSY
jgi:hypothetical protein